MWEFIQRRCPRPLSGQVAPVESDVPRMSWHQARQRLEYLEATVASIKVRHDAEIEGEKNKIAEEDRIKKEKENEERRAQEKLEREELNKRMMDNMNKRLDSVCLALFAASCVAETPCTTAPTVKTHGNDELLAKLMADQEKMKVQLDEAAAARKRLEKIEQEISCLRQARDDVKVEAEAWRQEALRPGSERGCVALSTPSVQATVLPRCTPTKTPTVRVDYKELKQLHQMEVDKLKELRLLELNGRRETYLSNVC
ncbi:hypothetical protein CBR_g57870 [Chara braunii]|uniref:Uncharacterized protein n=1 Tax=Chara braunii TaxID=69332 RepID=A0A388K879_CHABU|nr:hypothetical protein CBR_g57870 [Chara braunii]|eukprot:GBG66272.1 hypothetical protein CBR_g57870 [Chara braunii]